MFNKPGVFGRTDPVTRREASPAPSGVSPVVTPSADRTANPPKNSPSVTEASVTSSTNGTSGASANSAQKSLNVGASASTAPAPSASSVSPEAAAKETVVTKAVADDASEARLIVGPDVKLKGAEILDCDTLVVEGRVEATMDSRVIRIAENGSFSGKVSIDIAEIHGVFEGELTARSQLIIHSTGRVSGTIRFGTLVVDEGGELCGEINVLSEKTASTHRPVAEPFVAVSAPTSATG